ncbi:MAG TPA: hypothetical protein VG055_32595 [Planctomycetaceae bacterium]|jgi:hypothetical protein|nr:hypothetical protein [Planctomycetaceae bacterium]
MTDNNNHWEKYFVRSKTGEGTAEVEDDLSEDLISFGWLRGIRDQAIMLQVRYRNGTIEAFPYALLSFAQFKRSEGIWLCFGGKTIRIVGRNLDAECRPNLRLFDGIMRRRVTWIQEADEPTAMNAPKGALVIEDVREEFS